jgi:hypothetical protein
VKTTLRLLSDSDNTFPGEVEISEGRGLHAVALTFIGGTRRQVELDEAELLEAVEGLRRMRKRKAEDAIE